MYDPHSPAVATSALTPAPAPCVPLGADCRRELLSFFPRPPGIRNTLGAVLLGVLVLTARTCPAEPASADAPQNPAQPALKRISENVFELGGVRLDKTARNVSFPGVLNMSAGLIEYALVGSTGKIHESLLRTDIEPVHVHTAMLLLGVKDRTPRLTPGVEPPAPAGDDVEISFEWEEKGKVQKRRIEECIRNTQTDHVMSRGPWTYNGSRLVESQFMAQSTRSFIAVMEDVDALINNPRPGRENDKVWVVEEKAVPPAGMPVTIRIQWRGGDKKAP